MFFWRRKSRSDEDSVAGREVGKPYDSFSTDAYVGPWEEVSASDPEVPG